MAAASAPDVQFNSKASSQSVDQYPQESISQVACKIDVSVFCSMQSCRSRITNEAQIFSLA